jgi:manganese/zinc/iron transport system permease protein
MRNHRLWEVYLITHADVAPSHVDWDADMIEHVLPPEMVTRLEELAEYHGRHPAVP